MHDSTENMCFIHVIIAVEGRVSVIPRHFCEVMSRRAQTILELNGSRVLACKHERDHLHALINQPLELSVDDNIERLKAETQAFVIKEGLGNPGFKWQEGYYAVSCSGNELDEIADSIDEQEEYHRSISFKDEYIALLTANDIPYEEEDLFGFVDLQAE